MMRKLIFLVMIGLLASCGNGDVKQVATKIKTDTFPSKTILPPKSIDFERNLYYYFSLLPIESAEIFYEIPTKQIKDLYPKGREDSLTVSIESLDLGNYSLKLMLLKKSDEHDIICLIEQLQRSNKISFYEYIPEKKALVEAENVLPMITTTSFFEEEDLEERNLNQVNVPIYYMLEGKASLKAVLYTWMNPTFEGLTVPYDLILKWENDEFTVGKVKRINEDEPDLLGGFYGKRKILLGQANS